MMRRLVMIAGWLAAAVGATAGSGYLPVVGPPPIRFQLPPVLPTNQVILPPLAVIEPRPPEPLAKAPDPVAPLLANDSTNPVPANPLLDPLAAPPITEPFVADATNVTTSAQSTSQTINPQMFMRYFTGQTGTNAVDVPLLSPVGFIPPLPIVPPSSSATFQTTPPGKP